MRMAEIAAAIVGVMTPAGGGGPTSAELSIPTDWQGVLELLGEFGPRVVAALALLVLSYVLSRWARRVVLRGLTRAKFDPTLTRFFANLVKWVVLVLALVACLGTFGVNITSFAAVLGAAGLAIGLGLQGSLGHLASGLLLLIFRPFKVGDLIQVSGHMGVVDAIDLFTTTLDTPDNRRIVMPNSQVFNNTIENITHHSRRRADISVGVHYQASVEATRSALERAAGRIVATVAGALSDPPPRVVLVEMGSSSVNWQVRVWASTPDFIEVRSRATGIVKEVLDAEGIVIAFPQLDVHLDPAVESALRGLAAGAGGGR